MAKKQVGLGTVVKLATGEAGAFEVHPLVQTATPPARQRHEVDAFALDDDLDVPALGSEQVSRMVFTQFWHPGDTDHEKLDDLFDDKDEVACQLVTPHDTPVTDEFDVQVVGLEPEQLEANGMYARQVTLLRTSAITRT